MIDLLRERGAGHVKVFGGGGGVIVPAEIRELHDYGVARIFTPEDGQRLGLQGMINEIVAACDVRPRQGAARRAVGADRRRRARADALARTAHHRPRGGDGAAAAARRDARGGEGDADADAGDHRHRRRGQELAHRRDRPPLPPRPGRPAADRDRVHRPVAAQVRRRAARRPHPDERDRAPEHLHALARHARGRQRGEPRAARRDRRLQGRGLRPRPGRDLGHRPGRRGDRAARRPLAVRDDAGVRRRLAAREDRHARLRRLRRHQQVRPQGCGRRAARRAQAVPAQPRAVEVAAGGDAGVRHHGVALQRRRRHRALPGARRAPRQQRPQARAGAAGTRCRRGTRRPATASSPARASATSPRSPKPSASTTAGRASRAASPASASSSRRPGRCSRPAAPGRARRPTRRRSTPSSPSARRSSIRARGSSSTCGRRPGRPTAATSTW